MAVYVVGDIHGCFREWLTLKNKIESNDSNAEFILVGDILDKGPHTYEMLRWAMEKIRPDSKYQMVIGNHEKEKLDWLKQYLSQQNNFTKPQSNLHIPTSPDCYEFYKMCSDRNLNKEQLKDILHWLESLPSSIEKRIKTRKGMQHFVITHHQVSQEYLEKNKNAIVVHGHVPTIWEICKAAGAVSGRIWIQEKDINVDCGMVYGVSKVHGLYGDLAAIRLEDLKEYYFFDHKIS